MKNQFVGDINDYFKYGLLRALTAQNNLRPLGVWWMLTENDAGTHGNKLDYLEDRRRYKACDTALYKALGRITKKENRHVFNIEKSKLIKGAKYWPSKGDSINNEAKFSHEKLSDPYKRALDFKKMLARFKNCHLIFIDPDNGIETKSVSKERHIRWHEIASLYVAGKSLVIYQHKAQGLSLENAVPELLKQIHALLGAKAFGITCGRGIKKAEIAFLLIPQKNIARQLAAGANDFLKKFAAFCSLHQQLRN